MQLKSMEQKLFVYQHSSPSLLFCSYRFGMTRGSVNKLSSPKFFYSISLRPVVILTDWVETAAACVSFGAAMKCWYCRGGRPGTEPQSCLCFSVFKPRIGALSDVSGQRRGEYANTDANAESAHWMHAVQSCINNCCTWLACVFA